MPITNYIVYFIIVAALPIWAQYRVKSTYNKYAQVGVQSGLTGAEVARMILDKNGLYDVAVEPTSGFLSDHYDPGKKKFSYPKLIFPAERLLVPQSQLMKSDMRSKMRKITPLCVSVQRLFR
ncbi:Putative neutral zinc metallopeptidase [Listeria grayi]|uniref:Neutral zinc metallopeptidase n=1 Tax=Listeria grayi TaxID=1641 RepID=A0A378MH23_LISGR|nr:Putative neutral zinc metallopeptidase [Listeria grayi]